MIDLKCTCIDVNFKSNKAEPEINKWLAANNNLNIKFITEVVINGVRKITFYHD